MLPLFGGPNGSVGLGLVMFVNAKFTWMNKYFGTTGSNAASLDFTVEGQHRNFKREIWFNSMVSLPINAGRYHLRFEVTQPLLYSLMPRTRVLDAAGENVLYEHEKTGTWASQQGVKNRPSVRSPGPSEAGRNRYRAGAGRYVC